MCYASFVCSFVLLHAILYHCMHSRNSYCLRAHVLNTDIVCAYAPSCVGPADYQGGERHATFEISSNMATVEYSTVNDGTREGMESFTTELTVPPEMQAMGIVPGMPDRATVNITEDEG